MIVKYRYIPTKAASVPYPVSTLVYNRHGKRKVTEASDTAQYSQFIVVQNDYEG